MVFMRAHLPFYEMQLAKQQAFPPAHPRRGPNRVDMASARPILKSIVPPLPGNHALILFTLNPYTNYRRIFHYFYICIKNVKYDEIINSREFLFGNRHILRI